MKSYMKRRIYATIGVVLILGLLVSLVPKLMDNKMHSTDRNKFIFLKNKIQEGMREQGNYRCCLETPCTYCIEKSPGHGEGAVCDCLKDLMDGKHPCGECIGEILEGHGSPYLSQYFANAIAEKVGEEHLGTLQKIIEKKYGTPVEEQYVF